MMKNLIIKTALLSVCVLFYSNAAAQWVQNYNGPENSWDMGKSIAVGVSGNVYVTGYRNPYGDNCDYITVKYNSSGEQQWVQIYNGSDIRSDVSEFIALDTSENVYVTGRSDDGKYIVTIKYSSAGEQQWIQKYRSPNLGYYQNGYAIAIDSSGSVYVAGSCTGKNNSNDYVTIKYSSDGDSMWVRRYNGPFENWDELRALALDRIGNVYVTGHSQSFQGDIATIKYNQNGDVIWIRRYSNGSANSMAIDSSDNVYIAAYGYSNENHEDYKILKYNKDGNLLWVRDYIGSGGSADYPTSITTDAFNNIYVTGISASGYLTIKYNTNGVSKWVASFIEPEGEYNIAKSVKTDRAGNIFVTGASGNDIVTLKYNSEGVPLSVLRYDGPAHGTDAGYCLAVDTSGDIYVSGTSFVIESNNDMTTIKYVQQNVVLLLNSMIEGFYNIIENKMICDTTKVFLRNTISPYSIVDSAISISDSSGCGIFNFQVLGNENSYYIVIKHRNSIETWSNQKIMFQGNQISYDFTTGANKAYGNNLLLKGSKFCIYSGDSNQDGIIDLTDVNVIYNDAKNAISGYVNSDLTGDNFVDLSDLTIALNNSTGFVVALRP